jgi:ABC-2 type transport system ATP-binding protein
VDVLQVHDLEVRYGSHAAVQGVSFSIRPGEVFGLLGPNGAGKTSTLAAIEGLRPSSGGRVDILGIDPSRSPHRARSCLGVQLQSTAFQSELTVRELLALYAGLYGVRLTRRDLETRLESMGLAEDAGRRARHLSGGQQQRLSLLIALVHEPPLLLLDEPTSGLDPQSRRTLWKHVETQRAAGRSVLLTTHSMEEAAALADRIAIMVHGRIVAMDAPEALVAQFQHDTRALRVAHGAVTLEDVFLALAGEGEPR